MKIQLIIIEFSNIKIKINEKVSSIKRGHQIFFRNISLKLLNLILKMHII